MLSPPQVQTIQALENQVSSDIQTATSALNTTSPRIDNAIRDALTLTSKLLAPTGSKYSITCLKRSFKNRQNKGLNDNWQLNKGLKYCRMLIIFSPAYCLHQIRIFSSAYYLHQIRFFLAPPTVFSTPCWLKNKFELLNKSANLMQYAENLRKNIYLYV